MRKIYSSHEISKAHGWKLGAQMKETHWQIEILGTSQ